MRAPALLLLLAAAACAQSPVFVRPDTVAGLEAQRLPPQAPFWRLDRLFHRTLVTLSCTSEKAVPEAFTARSEEGALAKAHAAAGVLDTLSSLRGGREGSASFSVSPFGTTWLALRPSSRDTDQSCVNG